MDLRSGSVALALALSSALVLAACGGGDDSAESPPGVSAGTRAAASTTAQPTATTAAKPKKPAAVAAAAPAAPAVTPAAAKPAVTPKAPEPEKPAYRVAMPDGRTFPETTDWKFTNFKLRNQAPGVSGTVDVTYLGPGLASMNFTTLVQITRYASDGTAVLRTPAEFRGSVSAIKAGATETVQLLGDNNEFLDEDSTYEQEHTVESVRDDDPRAREN